MIFQAHPRVGGENEVSAAVKSADGGSSPRGRGKLPSRRKDASQDGLIPAWAGKTENGLRNLQM